MRLSASGWFQPKSGWAAAGWDRGGFFSPKRECADVGLRLSGSALDWVGWLQVEIESEVSAVIADERAFRSYAL